MKNKKLIGIIVGAIAAVLLAGGLVLGRRVLPTVDYVTKIVQALKPILNAENRSMCINAEAVIGGQSVTLDCKVYWIRDKDTSYLVVEQNGHSIYMTENILLLENGKAFKIADEMNSPFTGYSDLLGLILSLYENLEITAADSGLETVYQIRVVDDRVQQLLAVIFSAEEAKLASVEDLQVNLITKEETLDRIEFSAQAKDIQIHVTISEFQILSAGEYSIPAVITETAATVDADTLFSLTEDLYRLVLALVPFSDQESLDGSLRLTADCGLIQLDTTMDLADLKNTSNVPMNLEDLQALPEILGWLCLESDITCTASSGSYVYSLSLDQNSMQELSQMILPEMANYVGYLTEGSVSVILKEDRITSMQISIKGKINMVITNVPIAVSAEFLFK